MKKILLILLAFICCVNVELFAGRETINAYAIGEGISDKDSNKGPNTDPNKYGGGKVTVATAGYYDLGLLESLGSVKDAVMKLLKFGETSGISIQRIQEDYKIPFVNAQIGTRHYVDATPDNGFYLAGWVTSYGKGSIADISNFVGVPDEDNYESRNYGESNKTRNYYAVFKQVKIKSVTPESAVLETNDLNKTSDATFVFNVEYVDDLNDVAFSLQPLNEATGFSIVEGPTLNTTDKTITFKVRYKNDGFHNPEGNPERKATLTLSSAPGKNSKSVTITAKSNLQLDFTTDPDGKLNFTPDEPMNQGEERTKTITTTAGNTTANHATWHVAFEDPDMAAMMGYSLVTDPTNKDPQVKFTALDVNMAGIKTNLIITATYTSTNGIKITKSKTIELSANVGRVITINGYNESDLVFDLDYSNSDTYTTQNAVLYSTLDLNDVTLTPTGFPADNSIKYDWTTGATNIAISAKSNITPGQYKVNLLAKVSDIQATLNIDVNVRLAKPVVTATKGLGSAVFLSWESIYGASMYAVYSGETLIATTTNTSYNVTEVGGNALDDRNYLFMVKAIYNDDEEHFACRASDEILVSPSVAEVIDKNNYSYVEIYTGTDCPSNEFPYKPKQRIDFSSCFDASGNPLFDKLYIFGKTTNTNGVKYTYNKQVYPRINTPTNPDNATTCFNATTPLYVYNKVQGGYQLEQTLDATKTRFNHNTSLNGKKIYISGYCPFAYMGTTANEEGWMYFQGKNEVVDIYLDNCEIRGKYKTENGCNRDNDYKDYTVKLAVSIKNLTGTEYLYGSSSPFVFKSNSGASENGFTPRIHIKNNNLLVGQYGMRIKNVVGTVDVGIGGDIGELPTGIGSISQASAAVAIRPESKGPTNLTFDDNWLDGSITNGYLKLTSTTGQVGSIDLGNEMGSVTFNGGQYCVRNASADGNYTCNMMASMRAFTKEAQKDLPVGGTVTAVITLYGFGGDVPGNCKVTINSGTFTLEKNAFYCKEYYRDQENFMDLRLPWASKVNGGTFNGISHVVACKEATTQGTNPLNSLDAPLCLREDIVPLEQKTAYGSVSFDFNDESLGGLHYEDAYSQSTPSVDIRSGLNPETYGGQSLNPDEEGKLNLLLPAEITDETGSAWCDIWDNTLIRQWATCIPLFDVEKEGQSASVGGDVTVYDGLIEENQYKTNQLLYIEVDDVMLNTILEGDGMNILVKTKRANILNTKEYTIHKHQNLLKPIEADQWMTIVAPFDVHDISILEAVAEKDLEAMTREDAHKAQATAFLNFFNKISGFVLPKSDGRTTAKPLTTLMEWYGVRPYELIHYNGSNIREANYYLYELDNLDVDGYFSTNATGKELNIVWTPVDSLSENDAILKKGHVYAMQFPYCPLCDATRTEYDYWTGKYILLHGLGSQEVDGTNTHNTLLTNTPSKAGSAILKGNTSLNALTLPSKTGYVHNTTNDLFELNTSNYSVKPLETFMLYNPLAARMPKAISRSGKMIYEEQTTTGLPTIGDRTSLAAYADNMQIHLMALQAQRVVIYDMHGQVLFDGQLTEGEQMTISAPQGMYIVKGTYEIIKLIVD